MTFSKAIFIFLLIATTPLKIPNCDSRINKVSDAPRSLHITRQPDHIRLLLRTGAEIVTIG
jgi:hypothetical protein